VNLSKEVKTNYFKSCAFYSSYKTVRDKDLARENIFDFRIGLTPFFSLAVG
jgi:hypothetical protein